MAAKKETVTELTFFQKLNKLQEVMGSFSWEKDGINRHQSYKYVTEKQYKHNFKKALKEAGLIWKMETINHEFIPNISDKMHLVICDFRGELIDLIRDKRKSTYSVVQALTMVTRLYIKRSQAVSNISSLLTLM